MTYIPTITTARLSNDAVTSAKVLDSTLTNADIATAAAIAVTKLALGAADTVLQSDGVTNSFSTTTGANARVAVSKNSGATVGTRRRVNFVEGSGITLTIADDAGNEEVDVTIAASAGDGTLNGLSDVDTSGVVDGALLRYEATGTQWNDTASLLYSDAGQLQATTTGSAAGLLLGGDAQWYRSAADTMRTPDALVVDSTSTLSGKTTLGAAVNYKTDTKTANYTVNLSTDHTILVDSAGGAVTITLPASHSNGDEVIVKDSTGSADANNVTIDPADADTIDGQATYVISNEYEAVTLRSNGTNWFIV